jgi:hypothetical protein
VLLRKQPTVLLIIPKPNMSFGFGISDFESISNLSLQARGLLKKLRHSSEWDDEWETDINLMVDWLKDSMDLLIAVKSPAPSSVLAAMERCIHASRKALSDMNSFQSKVLILQKSDPMMKLKPAHRDREFLKELPKRMLETTSTFHNLVSQFYNRTQLDRLLELQKLTKGQLRDPIGADDEDDEDQGASEPKMPLTGNAGYSTSIFRGGITSSTAGSEKPQWWGVQGKFDSGSSVNMVSLELLPRCGLEEQAIEIEPITLQTREDQDFILKHMISLTWAMHNDTRSYNTDFYVDPKAIIDILLGDCFKERRHAENNNKSFLTAKLRNSTAGKSW